MKKILINFFNFSLAYSISAGAVAAVTPPPWEQMGPNGFQQPPGSWEFRPPRESRSFGFSFGNKPGRSYQYSFSTGGPGGPKMSFFGPSQGQPAPRQSQPFGQPNSQRFGQPRAQGFDPRQAQRFNAPYQSQQSNQPPRIEVTLSNDHPYLQEASIYTLRVVSDTNIKTIDVSLPKSDNVSFHKLDGPKASVRSQRGHQEIVNEFNYTLTPLRAGYLELPPIHITGTMASSQSGYGSAQQGKTFDVRAEQGLRLDVRPADPSLQPWLPLQHLSLRAGLEGENKIEAGKPITLWIETSATGATAAQLPSLEAQLNSPDFRVYREKTLNRSELSQDGRYLHGVRTEYFTLVPQYGGELQLPPVRIAWWNVNTGTKQYASLPIKPLKASGNIPGEGFFEGLIPATTPFPAGSSSVFWVPLTGIFGILLGYWLAIWLRNRNQPEQQRRALPLIPALTRLRKPARLAIDRFSPVMQRLRPRPISFLGRISGAASNHWRRVYQKLVFALPKSLRFWFCVRCARNEASPDQWGRTILRDACRHLGLASNSPLPEVADKIMELHPNRDAARLHGLIHQLDEAIYGSEQLDFERWKKNFGRHVRPTLISRRRYAKDRPRRYLPELNPKAA